MPILTLPETKTRLGETGTTRDAEIQQYIDAATNLVEDWCGPVVSRTVTQTGTDGTTILEGRVISVTSVLRDGVAVDYTLNARAGLIFGYLARAEITYTAGFSPIPEAIRLATLYAVQHAYESQNGAVPTTYGATDETFVISRGFFLPNRAKELLEPYRQGPAVA